MKIINAPVTVVAAGIALLGFASGQKSAAGDAGDTLRQYADKLGFGVGVFIQPRYWNLDPAHKATMAREFNRAITFAVMIQTARGQFDFRQMDEEMNFAKKHNMKLFGAGLIYRTISSPAWLHFNQPDCGGWSPEELDQIIREDVQTIVRHGGDLYDTWEVVNEPVSKGHNGCWSKILGQDQMIAKASRYVHQANPNVLVALNDTFGQEGVEKAKADEYFDLIKRVRALGGHIDVAGCEMHLEAQRLHPGYVAEFKYFLDEARRIGVQAQVTEMDVYQGPAGFFKDPYENQKQVFYNIAHACLKDSNCTTFSVWGLADPFTWLRPAKHLADASPLLFDEHFQKKPAYYGVLEALKEGR